MLHGSTPPGAAGSELTRLLARLADAPPADTRPVFAERLGQWLGWTGAITLSAALNTRPAPPEGLADDETTDRHRLAGAAEQASGDLPPYGLVGQVGGRTCEHVGQATMPVSVISSSGGERQ